MPRGKRPTGAGKAVDRGAEVEDKPKGKPGKEQQARGKTSRKRKLAGRKLRPSAPRVKQVDYDQPR